jgi:pimeloyl-ACP methyl ester carboxylesterase
MTRNILYIHGAYASPTTFRHMIEHLPDHRAAFADYDCLTNSVEDVVRSLKATAAESFGGEPYSIIAHSLGGVVGLRLAADDEPVEQIFTMSTPFGGSPLMHEANDGVVTVASQTSLAGPEYHPVAYNHFEVLLADPVIDLAREFLFETAA